ncbi:MAG: hypothetical protein ACOZCE_11800 [Spirochaetota bacterium]
MEEIEDQYYKIFPRTFLWIVILPFIWGNYLQKYFPFNYIHFLIFLLLSIYFIFFIIKFTRLIRMKILIILNFIFSWFLNIFDAIITFFITSIYGFREYNGILIIKNFDYENFPLYILLIMLFKISILTISFACIEKVLDKSKKNGTFSEINAISNLPGEQLNYFLDLFKIFFSKNNKKIKIEKDKIYYYYLIFYKPVYWVVILFLYISLNNFILLLFENYRKQNISLYVLYFLLGISILSPWFHYYYRKYRGKW